MAKRFGRFGCRNPYIYELARIVEVFFIIFLRRKRLCGLSSWTCSLMAVRGLTTHFQLIEVTYE